MGTPITPAITLSPLLDMLAPEVRAKPAPSDRLQAFTFQRVMESDPLGWWGSDTYEQSRRFRETAYIAIRAFMDAISGATATAVSREIERALRKAMPMPGQQGRDTDYTPLDEEHPLSHVIECPNGEDGSWTMSQELAYIALQAHLTGTAPVWTPFNEDGKPVRFFALPSATTQVAYQAGQNPQYPKGAYRVNPYSGGGWYGPAGLSATTLLPAEEIKRFRFQSPFNRWDGYSPLTAGARTMDILEGVDESRASAMEHGLQMDMLAIVPGLPKDEAEAMRASMTQKHGGARNAKRFGVLAPPIGSGQEKFSIQTFSQSAREMDYTGSWDQVVGAVLAIFRVPKSVAGLATATSYSELYAALRQFNELALKPFARQLSDFLTKALAAPWSEKRGQLKIQVDLPTLDDPDLLEKQLAADVNRRTVNECRAARNLPPWEGGDVPEQIYLKWLDAQVNPAPVMPTQPTQPGQAPVPSEEQPADGMPTEGDPNQASPEAAQDGITQAALEALGVGGAEEQPPQPGAEEIQKAQRQTRSEGQKWQSGGKWWTKKNGKIQEIGDPSKKRPQAQPAAKPAAKPAANSPARVGEGAGAIVSNMYDAVRQSLEKTGDVPAPDRRAGSTFAQAWDMVKAAGLHTHPESAKRFTAAAQEASQDPRSKQGGAAKTQAWKDALNKHFAGMSPAGKPGASPQQQAASPTAQPATVPPKPTPQEDAASQEAWKRIPDANKALAAKKAAAFAKSPEGKAILQRADAWAHQQAAKHADKVAAKLKCSPQLAQHILANAIKMLCRQALESPEGSAETSLTLNQPGGSKVKLGIARKPGPTSGAAPKPENRAAKGTGVPRVGKAMGRSQRVRELVARVLEPLNQE